MKFPDAIEDLKRLRARFLATCLGYKRRLKRFARRTAHYEPIILDCKLRAPSYAVV
jgi:hypothetical protein